MAVSWMYIYNNVCKDTKFNMKYSRKSSKMQDSIQNIDVIFIFATLNVVLKDIFAALPVWATQL